MKEKSSRVNWIDILRGLSMFLVVWGHAFPSNKGIIRKYIYSFHMPIFYFISGLTCSKDLDLDFKSFIKKKTKSLLIPYIIINLICLLIIYILSLFGIGELAPILEYIGGIFYSNTEVLIAPSGPTWFITNLILVEVLFYGLNKISKNDKDLFIMTTICGLIGYVNSLSPNKIHNVWHLETAFIGVVFYFIGYIFIKHKNKFDNFFKKKSYMFSTGFILGVIGLVSCLVNRRVSLHANLYGSITLFFISSLSTIFALICFVRLFLNKSYLFKNIGKYSLFYLGYHNILIMLYREFFPNIDKGNVRIFLLGCIVTLVMFPFAMLVYKKCPILIGKDLDNLFKKNKSAL